MSDERRCSAVARFSGLPDVVSPALQRGVGARTRSASRLQPASRRCGSPAFRRQTTRRSGLTLVELLITLAIFLVLAAMMVTIVREVVTQWTLGERRRTVYERASGILDTMADDLRLAMTREPAGVAEVKVKFLGDYEESSGTRRQRLMFVRSFEAGPERAITLNAGDGRGRDMALTPPADPNADPPPAKGGGAEEDYRGLKVGNFRALGGMAMVGFFVRNQTLYRAIKAPVEGDPRDLLDEGTSQKLCDDVLFLQFDYWGQGTYHWDAPSVDGKGEGDGPQPIWDSTRGNVAPPLDKFYLHRHGCEALTLNDPEDDVFPQKVRITVTVDSPMPRCLYTKLAGEISEHETRIFVDRARGFADGTDNGDEDSYLLIEDEWMRYTKKEGDIFLVDQRGARNTTAKGHAAEAVVRQGHTFHRVVFLAGWREDRISDNVYLERKKALDQRPRRILR
jgi:prepilin-type N-terminal cleavage/methylation domain-containing protein